LQSAAALAIAPGATNLPPPKECGIYDRHPNPARFQPGRRPPADTPAMFSVKIEHRPALSPTLSRREREATASFLFPSGRGIKGEGKSTRRAGKIRTAPPTHHWRIRHDGKMGSTRWRTSALTRGEAPPQRGSAITRRAWSYSAAASAATTLTVLRFFGPLTSNKTFPGAVANRV